MDILTLKRELETAIRLARRAGEVILDYYQTDLPVEHKAGDEPVTLADRVADDLIREGLQAAFPHDGLLTEESDDDRGRLNKERVWIVDPLDGTAEFITETGDFAVQIGLSLDGEPALGVVYQPAKEWLFYAVRGQGAYHLYDDRRVRLHVSKVQNPAQMCLVVSRSHFTPFLETARQTLGIHSVERKGSAGLKVGLVAQGMCDLYLSAGRAKEWDLCAPHALLLEAGGLLTDLRGEPLTYNKPDVLRRGFIASNGLAHERIVEALAPLVERMRGR